MPLTQTQIDQLKKKAEARGLDPTQLDSAIQQYQKGGYQIPNPTAISSNTLPSQGGYRPPAPNQPAPTQPPANRMSTSQPATNPQQSPGGQTRPNQPQEQDRGFVGNFIALLVKPAVNYTKFVGEAGAQLVRAANQPNIFGADKLDERTQELQAKSAALIQQAKNTKDKTEKQRLLDESRQIDAQIEQLGSEAGKIGDMQKSFLVDEDKIATRGDIAMTGAKATAGAASYVIPGGGTFKGALAAGATAGALYGFSDSEGFDVDAIISGAVGGAAGGALGYAGGKMLSKGGRFVTGGYKKLSEKFSKAASETAAQRINKACPFMWQRAVEDHGLDLNSLTEKYVSKAKNGVKGGVGYDDLIGDISERGRGGLFKAEMEAAEAAIKKALKSSTNNTKFTVDEVIEELTKEKKLLSNLPGNENNIAALDEFIKGFKAQYGTGITPKKALQLKRIADSRFGRAVADENTGSAIAQAQKMVANAMRSKLKGLIPEIGEALDTETELYTLQPVLNRARAIINTQGSEIRVGSLKGKGLIELITSIPDAYLSDPKRASQLISNQTTDVLEDATVRSVFPKIDISSQSVTQASSIAGSRVPGVVNPQDEVNADGNDSQDYQNQEQESGNINSEFNQNNPPFSDSLSQSQSPIPQSVPSPMNPFGNLTKRQALALALSQGASMSDIKELSELYDIVGSEDTQTITQETMQTANGLRTEYFQRTQQNGFLDVTNAYNKVASAPNTPAGDVSIVFAYMKLIDPGSVVREGEFATAENTAGIPDKVRNQYNKVLQGKRLGDKQRSDFVNSAKTVYQQYQNSQAQIDALYQGLANQYGIDPSLVGIGIYNQQQIGQ